MAKIEVLKMTLGLTHTSTLIVARQHLAATMGSGDLEVFATPALVALCENAAMLAVANHLPEGCTTVGSHIDLAHLKPSALGAKVEATATLTAIDGRKLTFTISATDGNDTIANGTHIRYVVDAQRFMSKLK